MALPWPPPEGPARQASDDLAVFAGSAASLTGGHATPVSGTLHLDSSAGLAWALYSLGGLDGSGTGGLVTTNFIVTPPHPGSLYLALANYTLGAWEITPVEAPQGQAVMADLASYISPAGSLHAALVQHGGSNVAIEDVTILRLGALPPPPQGLSAQTEGYALRLSWDAVAAATQYVLYRSASPLMSNPTKLATLDAPETSWLDDSVVPEQSYHYAVSCVRGDESPLSAALQATAPPEALTAPQNLSGTADVGVAHLVWDPVPYATSYRIYRAEQSDFSDGELLQAAPSATMYDDVFLPWDKIYYYRVSAHRYGEGPQSNTLDLHVPAANLPMPQNFRVDLLEGDAVTLAWDYDFPAAEQDGFRIYFSEEPDFSFSGPFYHYKQINDPAARGYTLDHLPPLKALFVRLAAFNAVGRGRATDDLGFITENGWTFGDVEFVGTGGGRVSAIQTSAGELACVYFNGTALVLAERNAGSWTESPTGLDSSTVSDGFALYADVAENGGTYCACSFAITPGDLWASIGAPGAWDTQRVHGDGSTGQYHPNSGIECRAAAIPGGFGLLHAVLLSGGDELTLHTTSADPVAWSGGDALATTDLNPPYFSLAARGSGYAAMYFDSNANDLLYGDSDSAWAFADIAGGDGPLGAYPDLKPFGSGWLTPAFDLGSFELSSLEGVDGAAAWAGKNVGGGLGNLESIHLASDGATAMLVYRTVSSPRWYYAYFDGAAWGGAPVLLPGYSPRAAADLVMLGSSPYFVFEDLDGSVRAALASPPV